MGGVGRGEIQAQVKIIATLKKWGEVWGGDRKYLKEEPTRTNMFIFAKTNTKRNIFNWNKNEIK